MDDTVPKLRDMQLESGPCQFSLGFQRRVVSEVNNQAVPRGSPLLYIVCNIWYLAGSICRIPHSNGHVEVRRETIGYHLCGRQMCGDAPPKKSERWCASCLSLSHPFKDTLLCSFAAGDGDVPVAILHDCSANQCTIGTPTLCVPMLSSVQNPHMICAIYFCPTVLYVQFRVVFLKSLLSVSRCCPIGYCCVLQSDAVDAPDACFQLRFPPSVGLQSLKLISGLLFP